MEKDTCIKDIERLIEDGTLSGIESLLAKAVLVLANMVYTTWITLYGENGDKGLTDKFAAQAKPQKWFLDNILPQLISLAIVAILAWIAKVNNLLP